MAGYHNYSMSNNAVAAYADGKMPLSKWTKKAILDECERILEEEQDPLAAEKIAALKKLKLSALRHFVLHCCEWHHTSSHYNCTDFYCVDEFNLYEMTLDDIAERYEMMIADDQAEKEARKAPTRRKGTIKYIVWTGTRNHPKANPMCLDGVEIEERGSFYFVFRDGVQVLKKKIDSNGTEVKYC